MRSPADSSAVSSSLTIFTTCWPAVRLSRISAPTARSRTRATKSLTTLKLTSASSRARRTSRIAASTSASVTRPRPVRPARVARRRSLRLSNMRGRRPLLSVGIRPRGSRRRLVRGFWRHRGGAECTSWPGRRPWPDGRRRPRNAGPRAIGGRYPRARDRGPPASTRRRRRTTSSRRPALWRNGAFVRVWTAATISVFGSFVTRIALPFVAILTLHAGADRGRGAAQPRPGRGAARRVRRRRVGRPAAPPAGADLGRPRARGPAGHDPGRGDRRLADAARRCSSCRRSPPCSRRSSTSPTAPTCLGRRPERARPRERRAGGDQLGDGVRRVRRRRASSSTC